MAVIDQFLIEFGTVDDILGQTTERFCTGSKFITKKAETPSLVAYLPLVKDAGSVEEFLYSKSKTTGTIASSAGRVVLNNGSQRLNYLLDRGVDGQSLIIRERLGDNYPADFPIRFQGVIEGISFSTRSVVLDIKSAMFKVRQEVYQPIKFAGTNDDATIYLEGTENLEGEPKPKLIGLGYNGNMPAVLVDAPNEIYQLSSEPCEIDNVYVGRAVISEDTKYTTLAAFISAVTTTPPTAGQYSVYEGNYTFAEGDNERGVYIAFGTTPNLPVTFDATEGWANECLQSEDFSTTWASTNTTVTTNDITAPDAQTTGDKLTKTASANSRVDQAITLTGSIGDYYTLSVCAKVGDLDTVSLSAIGSATRAQVEFDLLNVTTSTIVNNLADTGKLNPTIEALEDGWYRCSMSFDSDSASTTCGVYVDGFADTTAGFMYVWGAQAERYEEVSPYVATTTVAVLNNQAASNIWKVMKQRGHTLDTLSIIKTNQQNNSTTFLSFQKNETNLGNVINLFSNSIKAYVADTVSGTFICDVFKIPTIGEVELVVSDSLLMGDPKVKILRTQDAGRGIPPYRSTANWGKNGLVMEESSVVGASLSDMPFVSQEWRKAFKETAATKIKHLDAVEVTFDTALTEQSDAESRSQYELDLYDDNRLLVEIRLPKEVGFDLIRGDVVQVGTRIYRIVGKTTKFPSTKGSSVSADVITFQAWGGITV